MSQQLFWKAKFGSEYRKNVFYHSNDMNLEKLTSLFKNKFKIRNGTIKLMYLDDEKDWITLGDDADLRFALSTNKQVLHFKIAVGKEEESVEDNHHPDRNVDFSRSAMKGPNEGLSLPPPPIPAHALSPGSHQQRSYAGYNQQQQKQSSMGNPYCRQYIR